MSNKEFVNGLIVKRPRDGAPDFVKFSVSIKIEELKKFLDQRSGEWMNVDVKESRDGKLYAEVNNWKPSKAKEEKKATEGDGFGQEEKIPF